MRTRPRLLAACLLVLAPVALAGDLADDPRVVDAGRAWSEWLAYQAGVNNVPALSYGIVHDQELVIAGAIGQANPAAGIPAAVDTVYSICSISKLFTSIGVLQQRDAGRLRLDDPVAQHLDWFDIEDAHPGDRPITIRGLLTHSAGLPRESDYPYWSLPDFDFPTREQIIERLGEQQTLYPSSRYFQYSNLGLSLAGEIVAARSGQSFGDYIRANILDPLGMKSTFTDIPAELHGKRMAIGHSARNRDGSRDVLPLFRVEGIAPAAGFASTVEDLARFASWQFRLLGDGEDEVLPPSTLREMHRVHWVDDDWETTWGLGFAVRREGDRTLVGHGGGCPGYYTYLMIDPEAKLAAIVLSNAIGTETSFYAGQGMKLVGPAVRKALEETGDQPARDPELDRYVGVYTSAWGQTAVIRWEDGLAEIFLRSRDPEDSMSPLEKTGEHTFRRLREDGSPGETVFFEIGADGKATRFRQHSNWMTRLR